MRREQKRYIHDMDTLRTYLKTVDGFRNYWIGTTFWDIKKSKSIITIESPRFNSNEKSDVTLVWELTLYERGSSTRMIDDFFAQPLTELILDDNRIKFQFAEGYYSFEFGALSLRVPIRSKEDSYLEIQRVNLEYFFNLLNNGLKLDNLAFSFKSDNNDICCFIGCINWGEIAYSELFSGYSELKAFENIEEMFNSKIFNGKSLKERWPEVVIDNINGMPFGDWLTQFNEGLKINLYEKNDKIIINGVELDGWIDQSKNCHTCGVSACYFFDFDAYCCPTCNIWLTNDVGFEKRPLEPELLWKPNKLLPFCHVRFSPYKKVYTYYNPEQNLSPWEWVLVPVGKNDIEREAQVIKAFKSPAHQPPISLNKVKSVLQKLPSLADEVSETLNELLEKGRVCNLSSKKNLVDLKDPYDVLKTPLGHFWLELNNQPIQMSINAIYPKRNTILFVEGVYQIKPYSHEFEDFQHLKICTDVNIRKARYIDRFGDNINDGARWQIGKYELGIAARVTECVKSDVKAIAMKIPYYFKWNKKHKEMYGFTVVWQYCKSDINHNFFGTFIGFRMI
ncbi:hypothetical protein [Staphylococcus delphini]|uniref:hypothetical protein n=1 Tax=Staphylococcus delphini TaxID=53344 RepID=UPI0021CFC9D5|nr:hypothetical protein [Staphylococcus delphini]UXS45394.1 hypothetical protein MUA39_05940 [Staphylococcus delphini]UXV46016.1 hypothetical protein MUA63_05915 [Staphylococcus delphini]